MNILQQKLLFFLACISGVFPMTFVLRKYSREKVYDAEIFDKYSSATDGSDTAHQNKTSKILRTYALNEFLPAHSSCTTNYF